MNEMTDGHIVSSYNAFDDLDLNRALEVIRRDGMVSDDFRSALRRLSTFIMEDSRSVGHKDLETVAAEITSTLK